MASCIKADYVTIIDESKRLHNWRWDDRQNFHIMGRGNLDWRREYSQWIADKISRKFPWNAHNVVRWLRGVLYLRRAEGDFKLVHVAILGENDTGSEFCTKGFVSACHYHSAIAPYSFIYHPRCIMFFSHSFSFTLSVSFHHSLNPFVTNTKVP